MSLEKRKSTIYLILLIILLTIFGLFSMKNAGPVEVDLFFKTFSAPLAMVMVLCLLLGIVLVLAKKLGTRFKHINELNKQKKRVKEVEDLYQEELVKNKNLQLQVAELEVDRATDVSHFDHDDE